MCDAFSRLKEVLTSSNKMGYPLNNAFEFILDVDASDVRMGSVLHQVQGDQAKVIAYTSRALNKAESNYCVTVKELLAVRYFIEYFRQEKIPCSKRPREFSVAFQTERTQKKDSKVHRGAQPVRLCYAEQKVRNSCMSNLSMRGPQSI